MLKKEMLESPGKIILFVFLFNVSLPYVLFAETSVRSGLTLHIARNVWHSNYIEALEGAKGLIRNEPFNPSGYFLLGSIYQTISEEYRTDRYKDTISLFLDSAITLAEGRKTADADNPDWYFISGASFGYRALHRAFHGNWWGAFRDGLSCSSDLNHALELDSTYYDAYLGLGAYHYYRTIKAKDFLWLPFVSDQRQQGFSEVRKVIEQGYLATYNARQTLLRMYYTEGQYDSAVALGDSLSQINPRDPYSCLYEAESLIGLDRLDEAEIKVRTLRAIWKSSAFFDPFGLYEAEYLTAKIYARRGDNETAKKILYQIIADEKLGRSNAYYMETLDEAESFILTIK